MRSAILTASAFLIFASAVHAQQADVRLGDLTCTPGDPPKSDAGPDQQAQPIVCAFRAEKGKAEEVYVGVLRGSAAAMANGKAATVWVVRGPESTEITPGILAQTYTMQAGGPKKSNVPLIGEKSVTLALHPLAAEPTTESPSAPDEPGITSIELALKAAAT